MENAVIQIWKEYQSMSTFLTEKAMVSELNDYDRNFRKVLLLAAASFFEDAITILLSDFVETKSGGDIRMSNFLKKQALSQRFHQLFDWGGTNDPKTIGKNANRFFALFGEEFKSAMESEIKIKQDDNQETQRTKRAKSDSITAFLTIGHHRNILVHSNFAAYDYQEKTTAEIYDMFKAALPFIDFLKLKFQ